jgi:hypothetical protein
MTGEHVLNADAVISERECSNNGARRFTMATLAY